MASGRTAKWDPSWGEKWERVRFAVAGWIDHDETAIVVFTFLAVLAARFGPRLVRLSTTIAVGWLVMSIMVAFLLRDRTRRSSLLCVLIIGALPVLSVRALEGLAPTASGPFTGTVELVSDPVEQTGGGVTCVVRVMHKRLRLTSYGASSAAIRNGTAGATFLISGIVHEWSGEIPDWAVAKHLAGKLTVRRAEHLNDGSWPWRAARWVRRSMARSATALPASQRPLFGGFVYGDDRGQRAEVTDDFRASGLSHLLVVSGQNVAFVLASLAPLLQRLSPRARAVVAVMAILAFAVVTRFEPSVLRASMMATVAVTSRAFYRPQPPLRLVCVAVLVLLLVDPLLGWSVGFGLSIGATVGLALLSGPIERRLTKLRVPRFFRAPLAATLAAQAGTYPLLVGFGGVSPVSVPANLLALPAAEPLMIWGLIIGVPADLLGRRAATILHVPDRILIAWVAGVARIAATVVRSYPSPGWWPLAFLSALFAYHYARRRILRVVLLCVTCVALWWAPSADVQNQSLSRGRLSLFRVAGNVVLLAKPGADAQSALSDLRAFRVGSVNLLVLQRSTNAAWTSVGPVLARHDPKVIVHCGATTSVNGIDVVGLADGDVLRIEAIGRPWLRIQCERGRARIETEPPLVASRPE